jgi:mono/diheme cytochrome c family protein
MKRIVLSIVLAALLPATAAAAPDGAALYEKHCAVCHGARGQGGTATPPVAGMAASAIARVVAAHPSPMQKTGMTSDEIASLGSYVAGLKK